MTGVPDAGSLRLLLAGPTVLRTFAFVLLGRLAYGVLPLCFLFTVRHSSGAFADAAAASAVLGLATLAMPVQARLVDRLGQRRVLPIYAACYAALLLAAALLAQEHHSASCWLGLGLLLGLSAPALGPAMRAQWREIASEGPRRRRAYSLDSVCEESLYLVGPLIAGMILALGPAWVGLVLVAGLVTLGTFSLAASRYQPATRSTRPAQASPPTSGAGILSGSLLGLLSSLVLFGGGGAAVFVGVAALADQAGAPATAAVVEAVMAAGAVAGGLLWARFGPAAAPRYGLTILLLVLALAQSAAVPLTPNVFLVAAVLAVGSLATSPVYVVAFVTVDDVVPEPRRTEASTWATVGANLGNALGTAGAGALAHTRSYAPFLLAALLSAAAAAVALTFQVRRRGIRQDDENQRSR